MMFQSISSSASVRGLKSFAQMSRSVRLVAIGRVWFLSFSLRPPARVVFTTSASAFLEICGRPKTPSQLAERTPYVPLVRRFVELSRKRM